MGKGSPLTSRNSARCVSVPILTSSMSFVQYSSNTGKMSLQVISLPNTRANSCSEKASTRRIFHCAHTHTHTHRITRCLNLINRTHTPSHTHYITMDTPLASRCVMSTPLAPPTNLQVLGQVIKGWFEELPVSLA